MDAFYALNRSAVKSGDYELAELWNSFENAVNSIHHGIHPAIWLEDLKKIIGDQQTANDDTSLAGAYADALELVAVAVAISSSAN